MIGQSAAVIGISSLIVGVVSLGISSGATRMFGQACGKNDRSSLSMYFASSFALNLAIIGAAAVLVFFLGGVLGMSQIEIPFVSVLIVLTAASQIPTALFNSTLRTSAIALSSVLSALFRLAIGIALLYLGTGFLGVMLAFVIASVVQDLVLLAMLRNSVSRSPLNFPSAMGSLKAGIPSWIPSLIATGGTWLGVLGVYSLVGSTQAGTYYIAFMISQIVYTLPASLLTLMFPVLSGMEDGRKRSASRSIKLSTAIVAPIAAIVIAYPSVPLSMLGPSYVASAMALQILLVGCFLTPISSGFNSLVYAYGRYRFVTILGLAINIPRVALYPLLVSLWGDNGAALSYISGLVAAIVVVYFMAKRIGFAMGWLSSLTVSAIPCLLVAVMALTRIPWFLGAFLTLIITAAAYARLGVVTRTDLAEISSAFISKERLYYVYPYAKYILDVLYGK
jgi:O-antigen/teichoic acid export membrane protein